MFLLGSTCRANWRNENCDSILLFALPNDVMFKSDDSAHLSYRFVYLIVLNETKKLNVDTNLSTTEHAFTESCEGYIYILL